MRETTLEIRDLTAGYERPFCVLDGLNVTLGKGEIVGIVGRNGVGKTTLVRVLAGLLPVWHGEIVLHGKKIGNTPPRGRVAVGLAIVPEGRRIFGSLTVQENLEVAAAGAGQHDWRRRLPALFEVFPQLSDRAKAQAANLSGGEQQMLAIARGLIADPQVLVMDEPSLGLSPRAIRDVEDVIRRTSSEGVSVLLMEQNHQMTVRLTKNVLLMDGLGSARPLASEELADASLVGRAMLGGH